MVKNILISVIVPTFNSEKYISDMLYSLGEQTFRNFEVLVCDGGSTDRTLEILSNVRIPNFAIVSRTDAGVPDALNKGFSAAKGDYFCWLNSDDVYVNRNCLAQSYAELQRSGSRYGYGHTFCIDEAGIISRVLFTHVPRSGYEDRANNLITGSLFFSRGCWLGFGGFSGKYKFGFEYEIKKHLSGCCGIPALLNFPISALRAHENTITSRMSLEISREVSEIFSDRPRKSYLMNRIERKLSQAAQGTLINDIRERIVPRYVGKHWREVFVKS